MRNEEVAHRWAQDDDTRASARHLTIERQFVAGSTMIEPWHLLVSYRTPIAVIRDDKAGRRVALVTTEQHSTTTSAHKSAAHGALHGSRFPVFSVENIRANDADAHKDNMRRLLESAADQYAKSTRARMNGPWLLDRARATIAAARDYAAAFRVRVAIPEEPADAYAAVEKQRADAERAQKQAARRKQREERGRFDAWLAGEPVTCPQSYAMDDDGSVYLRRVHGHRADSLSGPGGEPGEYVETSRGAVVPWRRALALYGLASRRREVGLDWTPPADHPIRVGPYTLDRIDAQGNATVGCHLISWARMHELAEREGVTPAE